MPSMFTQYITLRGLRHTESLSGIVCPKAVATADVTWKSRGNRPVDDYATHGEVG